MINILGTASPGTHASTSLGTILSGEENGIAGSEDTGLFVVLIDLGKLPTQWLYQFTVPPTAYDSCACLTNTQCYQHLLFYRHFSNAPLVALSAQPQDMSRGKDGKSTGFAIILFPGMWSHSSSLTVSLFLSLSLILENIRLSTPVLSSRFRAGQPQGAQHGAGGVRHQAL